MPLAGVATVVMWGVMFYAGFLAFKQLAPARSEIVQLEQPHETVDGGLEGNLEEQAKSTQ